MSESAEELLERARRERAAQTAASDPTLAWRPFPLDQFPLVLRRFIAQGAAALQVDPSMLAMNALAPCGAAIGNSRVVLLKKGFTQPAVLWCSIAADPSCGKGPAQRLAVRPIVARQSRHDQDHRAAVEVYQAEQAAWAASTKEERAARREPQRPVLQHCLISDATAEAIGVRLWQSPRGVLCSVEELASILKSFNQYKRSGTDKEAWIGFYDAAYVKIDRKTGLVPTQIVPHAFVGLVGGIQPGVLSALLGSEDFDSGFAHRFLFAAPPRTPKRWDDAEVDDAVERAYAETVDALFELALPEVAGAPRPQCLPLTDAARAAWGAFFDDVEGAINEDDGKSAVFDALPKLRSVAARLALILQLVSHVSGEGHAAGTCVDETSMTRGIGLARWFIHEQRRVYRLLGVSKGQRRLARIVQLVRDAGGAMSVRDYQRKRSLRSAETAEQELQLVVDAQLGSWAFKEQSGAGKPSKRLVLNDNIAAGASAAGDMVCQTPSSKREPSSIPFPDGTVPAEPDILPADRDNLPADADSPVEPPSASDTDNIPAGASGNGHYVFGGGR